MNFCIFNDEFCIKLKININVKINDNIQMMILMQRAVAQKSLCVLYCYIRLDVFFYYMLRFFNRM